MQNYCRGELRSSVSGIFDRFAKTEPITYGWSGDKKYCVESADGTKYFLRISSHEQYDNRKALFEMKKQVAVLGVPMCLPIEVGSCDDGVFTLDSWIDGRDLRECWAELSEQRQYELGVQSGRYLRKIHSIPAPVNIENWSVQYNRKTDLKIQKYHDCGLRFNGDEHILRYIEQNRHLLENRPQCFQHGDFHEGNMMLANNSELVIIDFDRYSFGDPWEEFNRITWSAKASPHFASGQLNGYFNGAPPLAFFETLAFYIAVGTLAHLPWAIKFGQDEVDIALGLSQEVLRWYDDMRNVVPTWYNAELTMQNAELGNV